MSLKSGLTHTERTRFGLVVVANLRGLVCPRCGARGYDPPTYGIIVEATLGNEAGFGARAKVSRLSRHNVGAYIPKDLQAHMGIQAGDTLILQPLSRSLLVVEVEHAEARPEV
ncbi:MAG TPA: hypothetical protein VGB18_09440 [Candidatus Thermoplasmatota archaeon]